VLQSLNAKVAIPSHQTLSRYVQEVYQTSQARVISTLRAYPRKFHLCIDGWTSPNVISFAGLTIHWVHESRIQSVILNFIKVTAHTGMHLASHISNCLHIYGIQGKIHAIVLDNAPNHDTLIRELPDLLDGFQGSLTRVRCFAHILNLAVKAILSQFTRAASKAFGVEEDTKDHAFLDSLEEEEDDEAADSDLDEGDEDADDVNMDTDQRDNDIVQRVIESLEGDINDANGRLRTLTCEEVNLGRFTLTKLINLGKRIFNSPIL
jgi:hypothetical protein